MYMAVMMSHDDKGSLHNVSRLNNFG